MKIPTDNKDVSRRDFLQLSWALGAGTLLPGVLAGCAGSTGPLARPGETFIEPKTLTSANGLLDVTLTLGYLNTTLDGKSVSLRSFNQSLPAPTLRLNPGDKLRILLDNKLPANPPSTEPVVHLRYPNSTNLHTHGLHVDPGVIRPGVYGDYVVDDPESAVQPGQKRQHEYQIGAGHPPGAYFYHPHLHGATAIQMASGMAGAIIVGGGEINRVPEIAAAAERVFMLQTPIVDQSGKCESFALVAGHPTRSEGLFPEKVFFINGVRRPRIVLYQGEVQNWHLVNAGIFTYVNASLDGHALNLYSIDGNPQPAMKAFGPGITPDGVVLAPGNRASVLVQAGRPGFYYLRNLAFATGDGVAFPNSTVPEDIIAEVVVLPESMPTPMRLPASLPPVPHALRPITDEELAAHGGVKRYVALRAVSDPNLGPGGPPNGGKPPLTPAGLRYADGSPLIRPGDELDQWVFNSGLDPSLPCDPSVCRPGLEPGQPTNIANTVWAMASLSTAGANAEFFPFQSRRAVKQTVPLGSVEEWTVYNMNNIRHPFHIHVNPVMVTKVNGVPVEPYWVDTIGLPNKGTATRPTSVTFRTRFEDFRGPTVMHCHMLVHEDMGMMQWVDIV